MPAVRTEIRSDSDITLLWW